MGRQDCLCRQVLPCSHLSSETPSWQIRTLSVDGLNVVDPGRQEGHQDRRRDSVVGPVILLPARGSRQGNLCGRLIRFIVAAVTATAGAAEGLGRHEVRQELPATVCWLCCASVPLMQMTREWEILLCQDEQQAWLRSLPPWGPKCFEDRHAVRMAAVRHAVLQQNAQATIVGMHIATKCFSPLKSTA